MSSDVSGYAGAYKGHVQPHLFELWLGSLGHGGVRVWRTSEDGTRTRGSSNRTQTRATWELPHAVCDLPSPEPASSPGPPGQHDTPLLITPLTPLYIYTRISTRYFTIFITSLAPEILAQAVQTIRASVFFVYEQSSLKRVTRHSCVS